MHAKSQKKNQSHLDGTVRGAFTVAGYDREYILTSAEVVGVTVMECTLIFLVLPCSRQRHHQIPEKSDVMQRAPFIPLFQSPPSPLKYFPFISSSPLISTTSDPPLDNTYVVTWIEPQELNCEELSRFESVLF